LIDFTGNGISAGRIYVDQAWGAGAGEERAISGRADCVMNRRLQSATAKGLHSEEIRWERVKTRDLVLKYNGILGVML